MLRSALLPPLLLLSALGGLLIQWDLAAQPWLFLGLMTVATAAWAVSLQRELRYGSFAVLAVAVVARLLLLPLPPSLSDDTLRYVWDGRVLQAGFNPYALSPDDPALTALRDEAWQRMPHREVATVYPPVALGVFSIATLFPSPFLALKILLTLADLLGCYLLIRLAGRLGMGAGRTVGYAWNPLVCVEVAGMGHVDGLMALTLIATVGLLVTRRTPWAALSASLAVLVKLVPVVGLVHWARHSKKPVIFLALASALLVVGLGPVLISTGGVPPGLVTYGVSWEFNGPLYEPLWRTLDHRQVDLWVKGQLDQLKLSTGRHEFWNRFYPYVYAQFLAKMLLAALLALLLLLALRDRHPVSGSGRVFAAVILCVATVYPWYLLWILPWAALCRHRAWLTLAATMPLCYLPQFTELELFPWVFLAIWGPFVLMFRRKAWRLAPWAGSTS